MDAKMIVEMRSKILNPDKAKTSAEVEDKVAKWKLDIAKLVGAGVQEAIKESDRVQPYWSMMPDEI